MMIGAVAATKRMRERKPHKWRPRFWEALRILAADGMVTAAEEKRINELTRVRNLIAHQMHEMTYDLSRDSYARTVLRFAEEKYRYDTWKEVKALFDAITGRMRSKYIFEISMDSLLFRAAERTYDGELKLLDKRIRKQMVRRNCKNDSLRRELSLEGTEFGDENFPSDPANTTRAGNLTKRGVEVCFGLFDLGKSPLAVAHLMHISLNAIKKRHKQWVNAGGKDRKRNSCS